MELVIDSAANAAASPPKLTVAEIENLINTTFRLELGLIIQAPITISDVHIGTIVTAPPPPLAPLAGASPSPSLPAPRALPSPAVMPAAKRLR